MIDEVVPIDRKISIELIQKYHYSKVMPRITKYCIGGIKDCEVVATCTFGYGVRPLHTIKKIFPSLEVRDYFTIGKLCVSDEMPRNTESNFISKCLALINFEFPEKKIIFSWADGIIGKPGYVYQASNFYYGGFIWTEMYLDKEGNRVHPRSFQGISKGEKKEGQKFRSRSFEVTTRQGYTKYFGLQFRYVYPLCRKKEWKKLCEDSPFEWRRNDYPKDRDCLWKKQIIKGKRIKCGIPPFKGTDYVKK